MGKIGKNIYKIGYFFRREIFIDISYFIKNFSYME